MADAYEQLGLFYLGKRYDLTARRRLPEPVLYDSKDLVTHALTVGMTGSGKTGLGLIVIEEAAIDGIPVLAIDPKGDLSNLLLTFPDLSAEQFAPWVDPSDAARRGLTANGFAAQQAEAWRTGLAEWDQDASRIARLRAAADVTVYTPGSRAGEPLAILQSLAPSVAGDDDEAAAARLASTAQSILALAGLGDVGPQAREAVLVTHLLDHAWRRGQSIDLPWLIHAVQKPPIDRIGVMDLETFFPARERQELALRLNNVLAAPGFDVWLQGTPLDAGTLLFTAAGRPRVAIVSIAHLNDAERMLVVSLLLNEVLAWTRRQTGTGSLRALVYMDEIFGFFPPVANPPSKPPLLTLLKQARAFGVGVMLATQNPVDLDYKGLANTGTWFLGKLQTERDKARVLDGLEGAAAGRTALNRAALDATLSALGSRQFLLHNVHEAEPVVFETRWTLSYLRGPLTVAEIKRLSNLKSQIPNPNEIPAPKEIPAAKGSARPVLPAGIREFFLPGGVPGVRYEPHVYGSARVRYRDAARGVDAKTDVHMLAPIGPGPIAVEWDRAATVPQPPEALMSAPTIADASYAEVPAPALDPKQYAAWERDLERWLADSNPLRLMTMAKLGMTSTPGESERDFRARVQHAAHERRDAAVEQLRARYAPKIARLTERLARARDTVAREQRQVTQQKMQTAVSLGATVIGALMGRKAVSVSTLGRATTAARGVSRAAKEAEDVERASERAADVERDVEALQADLQEEIDALGAGAAAGTNPLDVVEIKPARGGVDIRLLGLAWVPST